MRPAVARRSIAGRVISDETRVVSFVARSLDRVRGFDRFLARCQCVASGSSRRSVCRCRAIRSSGAGSTSIFITAITVLTCWRSNPSLMPIGSGFWVPRRRHVVAEVLAASDLHIAPSRSYPVARSLLEAMAAGCVVLASDTAPHREVIVPGQTGLLVDGARYRTAWRGRRWPCSRTAPRIDRWGMPRQRWCASTTAQDVCLPRLAERFYGTGRRREGKAVNVLFIHDAFPAQFGRLGLELTRRHGWRCSFLVQSLSSCPTPSREMLETLDVHKVPLAAEHRSSDGIPWPQIYGHYLEQCRTVHDAVRGQARACVPT